MNKNKNMTPDEEHAFYADPDNQTPQGPAVRRRQRLADPVPVRLPPDVLERVRLQATADHRSISSWVRLAVEHELDRVG